MKQSEYEALKTKIEELRILLAMAVVEKEKFEVKGNWVIQGDGHIEQIEHTVRYRKYFNLWETEEQAKQASIYEYNHKLIMNYVMQFDGKIGLGDCYIYNYKDEWRSSSYIGGCYYPEVILMTKECAEALIQDIKDGVVVFKDIK